MAETRTFMEVASEAGDKGQEILDRETWSIKTAMKLCSELGLPSEDGTVWVIHLSTLLYDSLPVDVSFETFLAYCSAVMMQCCYTGMLWERERHAAK